MNAELTFWGHNCFLVETDTEVLLMDPWLNDTGAFFGSWHQWPPNGHLREAVLARCAGKTLSLFLTHEHQDHFDRATLALFASHPDCTVYIPAYKDSFLREALGRLALRTVELAEGESAGKDIRLRIFIDDSGINHDSAIFVQAPGLSFFNQNDCKIFDRLRRLKSELGDIDYYSVQYSGANWHPACFDLPEDQRRQLARKKVLAKLRNVLTGIKILAPRFFVPAAGPAFFPFLDPALNSGEGSIFVHQDALASYLAQHRIGNVVYPRPGQPVTAQTSRAPIPGPTAEEIARYRATHRDVWQEIGDDFAPEHFASVLQRRLDLIAGIALPADTPAVAFQWGPNEGDWLVADLAGNELLRSLPPGKPCEIVAADRRYFSLLCGSERWQDIVLSMRARVRRVPDVYNTLANIFLFADESNLRASLLQNLNLSKERIVIAHRGQRYEIKRYCPHQGGDLAYAHIDEDMNVVCPRHSWRFDLACAGMCKSSGMSIDAVKLVANLDEPAVPE